MEERKSWRCVGSGNGTVEERKGREEGRERRDVMGNDRICKERSRSLYVQKRNGREEELCM